jgi:hypothetical protein
MKDGQGSLSSGLRSDEPHIAGFGSGVVVQNERRGTALLLW